MIHIETISSMSLDTGAKSNHRDKILGMIYGNIFGNIIGGHTDLLPTTYIRTILSVLSQMTNDNLSINVANICKRLQEIAAGTSQIIQKNEYIGIASMLGSLSAAASSEQSTAELAARISSEPQFIALFIAQTAIIFYLIHGDSSDEKDIDQLLFSAIEISRKYLALKATAVDDKIYWKKHDGAQLNNEFSRQIHAAYTGSSAELHLDNPSPISCLCCSVYALQVIKVMMKNKTNINFSKVMLLIKNCGGQSDINCAIVGGVLGAYIGYSKLSSKYPPIAADDAEVIAQYASISVAPIDESPITPVDSIDTLEQLENAIIPHEKCD